MVRVHLWLFKGTNAGAGLIFVDLPIWTLPSLARSAKTIRMSAYGEDES